MTIADRAENAEALASRPEPGLSNAPPANEYVRSGATSRLVLAATLASLFAFVAVEVTRGFALAGRVLAHDPTPFDRLRVALAALFLVVALGAVALATRLAADFVAARLVRAFGLGTRTELVLTALCGVAAPAFAAGCIMLEGTRSWVPHRTAWLVAGASAACAVALVFGLRRGLEAVRERASHPFTGVVGAALALGLAGSLAWALLALSLASHYGKTQLVTLGLLVLFQLVVFDEMLRVVPHAGPSGGRRALVALAMVAMSAAAFFAPASPAARESFFAAGPTRWFGIVLADLGPDADGDGFSPALGFTAGLDCDDGDARRNPRQPELVGNGVDENCFGGDQTETFAGLFAPRAGDEDGVAGSAPKNVLVLLIDSLRFDAKSPGGVDPALTPAIATFARESLAYENYRTCSPRTRESLSDLYFGALVPARAGGSEKSAIRRVTDLGVHTLDVASAWRRHFDVVRGWSREITVPGRYGESGDSLVALELERLLGASHSKPFFLSAHLLGAHEPYAPAAACGGRSDPYARYACALRTIDGEVRKVLAALSRSGLAETTVVVVSADHGEEFGEHGSRYHASTVYDEVLRVPLLVRIPGVSHERVREPMSCFDFMPTLRGAAGFAPDPALVGRDFSRAPRPADRTQFARTRALHARGSFEPKSYAVVHRGVKLRLDRHSGLVEYFELGSDPGELRPLPRVRPELERRLVERMDAWLSELARQSATE